MTRASSPVPPGWEPSSSAAARKITARRGAWTGTEAEGRGRGGERAGGNRQSREPTNAESAADIRKMSGGGDARAGDWRAPRLRGGGSRSGKGVRGEDLGSGTVRGARRSNDARDARAIVTTPLLRGGDAGRARDARTGRDRAATRGASGKPDAADETGRARGRARRGVRRAGDRSAASPGDPAGRHLDGGRGSHHHLRARSDARRFGRKVNTARNRRGWTRVSRTEAAARTTGVARRCGSDDAMRSRAPD